MLDAPLIREGSQLAAHPAVLGDQLLTYLTTLVTLFNAHVHPGELALGVLPDTGPRRSADAPTATPALVSLRVAL